MPIQGVSDRDSLTPRFKSLGKLKKGKPKSEGLGDLDYFRFDSEDSLVIKAFHDAYGMEPTELLIYIPRRTMEEVFSSWRELYGQNGLCKVRCDGSTWVDWIDGAQHRHGSRVCTKEFRDTENRCPGCPLKPVGRLELILPELWEMGYIGLVTLETHSWNDIFLVASVLAANEPLTGKPFTLWREDVRIGAPNEKSGKRMAVTKSLVKLQLTDEYLQLQFENSKRKALLAIEAPKGDPEEIFGDTDESSVFVDVPPDVDEPSAEDITETIVQTFINNNGQLEKAEHVNWWIKHQFGLPPMTEIAQGNLMELLEIANGAHWSSMSLIWEAFHARAVELGTEQEILEALDVEDLVLFEGTPKAALKLLEAYAAKEDKDDLPF